MHKICFDLYYSLLFAAVPAAEPRASQTEMIQTEERCLEERDLSPFSVGTGRGQSLTLLPRPDSVELTQRLCGKHFYHTAISVFVLLDSSARTHIRGTEGGFWREPPGNSFNPLSAWVKAVALDPGNP